MTRGLRGSPATSCHFCTASRVGGFHVFFWRGERASHDVRASLRPKASGWTRLPRAMYGGVQGAWFPGIVCGASDPAATCDVSMTRGLRSRPTSACMHSHGAGVSHFQGSFVPWAISRVGGSVNGERVHVQISLRISVHLFALCFECPQTADGRRSMPKWRKTSTNL